MGAMERRTVLQTGCALAALAGVAGCTTPAERTKEAAKSAPPAQVDVSDIPVGGGVVLNDAAYVVTQPEKGTYKAFNKICTHQGCPVGRVEERKIVCLCHGSQFSIQNGSVEQGPAEQPLTEIPTRLEGTTLSIGS